MPDPEKKEEKKEEKPGGDKEYTNKQFADAIRFLGGEMKKMSDRSTEFEKRFTEMSEAKPKGGDKKESQEKATDVELMTNAQLAEHIVKLVTEGLQPQVERLDALEGNVGMSREIGRAHV